MKRIVAIFGVAAYLTACGDNNVGNRTYDMNTPVDSASYPIGNTHDDTTATTNNNIYNPDSMPANATHEDMGSSQSKTEQSQQQRVSAGASVPQINKKDSQQQPQQGAQKQ